MATLAILAQRGDLIALGGGLNDDEQPERLLYAFPHVIEWLDKTLPSIRSDFAAFVEQDLSPLEQVDALLHDFVSGADFAYYERSHAMTLLRFGVWELKTLDIRLFGWFYIRACFIIANINTAFQCKEKGLYDGYRNDTGFRRNRIDLDPPKFIVGEYSDVL
jgi:hypothetical protein